MEASRISVRRGTLYVFLASLLFSLGGLGIKLIPWQPLSINGARNLISIAMIALYMKKTGHRLVVNKGVLTGAFCMCATTTLYVISNKLTTAANAIVLQFTAPIFLIFIMAIFFHEKPTRLDLVTCAVVLAGIVCFFIDSLTSGGGLGNLLAILSGATYAGVFMLNTFPGADSLSSILIGQIASGLIGIPFLIRETDFSTPVMGAVFMLGFFQLGLAYIFFSRGLEAVPPVMASLTSGLEPVLNPVWVALFYKETISKVAMLGAVIVVGAIVCYNLKKAINQQKQQRGLDAPFDAADDAIEGAGQTAASPLSVSTQGPPDSLQKEEEPS